MELLLNNKYVSIDNENYDKCNKIIKAIFCTTLASKNNIKKDVDKIFEKNKIEYIKAYRNSDIYSNLIFKGLTIDIVMYSEKIAGILEYSLKENNFDDLYILSKKAFKKIHLNIKNKDEMSIVDIFKHTPSTIDGNIDSVSAIYMYSLLGRMKKDDPNVDKIVHIIKQFNIFQVYKETNFSKVNMDEKRDFIKQQREFFGIKNKTYMANELIDEIELYDIQRYNQKHILMPDKQLDKYDTYTIESLGEVSRYIGGYEGLFKYLGTETERLLNNTLLTKSTIDELIVSMSYSYQFNNFNDEDRKMYFISSIYLYALNKEYLNIKDKYLKDFNEEFIVENNKLQTELNEKIYELKCTKENYEHKSKVIEEEKADLLAELEKYKKEVTKLEQKVKENEDAKIENVKLRRFIFEGIEDSAYIELIPEDSDINYELLNDNKVVILGGSTPWINKMKEKLPNAIFSNSDTKNSTLDFINEDSIVFINTNMKHSFYYKIKSIITKLNLDYNYINNYTNINKCLKDMTDILNSK